MYGLNPYSGLGLTCMGFCDNIASMKKEEIENLAILSRLELSEAEVEKYSEQFDEILHYVDKIKEIKDDNSLSSKLQNDEIKNIFRSDDDIQEGGIYTERIIGEAPKSQDGFVKVKKILNND